MASNGGSGSDERDGVSLTNLDQPLFPDANATKRDLVDYLDAMAGPIIAGLRDRPLSVIRVLRGQDPFMQKNLPKYAPPWIRSVTRWAEASRREVKYALCDDRRTLMWFANQRAVEYHPALIKTERWDRQTHLILDIDPPAAGDSSGPAGSSVSSRSPGSSGSSAVPGAAGSPGSPGSPGTPSAAGSFQLAVRAAHLVQRALDDIGLAGVAKTSGAKGLHVFVPLDAEPSIEDVAAATRALAARAAALDPELATTAFIREDRGGRVFIDSTRAGGATVVAAYSPRVRPGAPVSFPVPWDQLDHVVPADFTLHTAVRLAGGRDPWADLMPAPQSLPTELIAEGHAIPIARVQAMHEGKRRARARRE
jgi:bifunctional non-homologous end joining protein LigD